MMNQFQQVITLQTERLILRQWKDADFESFYQLNADPTVMQYFPNCLNQSESNALAEKFQALIHENGWGFWAVELKKTGEFIGFVGLHDQPTQFSFSPCVEMGWRLAKQFWHQGYATEAAHECLNFAFEQLALEHVVAFTAELNTPSQKVMQRLNMQWVTKFSHPKLEANHPLAQHCLYKISQQDHKKKS